jgi:CMP-N,N'-diacetyllegionaminic acid synthase
MLMKTTAIILARGGSKGVPKKNIVNFCGKPLLVWTLENCLQGGADSVYLSSDSDDILEIGENYGSSCIKRPKGISGDSATSESGWLHAIDQIEKEQGKIDWVLAPQVTSPLRTATDIKNAFEVAKSGNYDSIFSCSLAEDLFFWEISSGKMKSVNYDWKNRQRRQDIPKQYIENGSFYLFRPEILRNNNNRFGGRIGVVEMAFWKMFEIDSKEDIQMCSALMKEFIISEKNK